MSLLISHEESLMKQSRLTVAPSGLICLLTLGLSISLYAIDERCVNGHEICPEHLTPTTFTTTYEDMINNQVKPTGYATPKAPSVIAPKAELAVAPKVPLAPAIVATGTVDSDNDGILDVADQCANTPKGYKVDAKGCPSSVTLHINFATGSNALPVSSDKDVQTLITFMQENPAATITIIGHTDNVGKAAKNLNLSKARAEALALRIIKNGVSDQRIKTDGKGLTQPVASNKTTSGRAQNRRIDVQIR